MVAENVYPKALHHKTSFDFSAAKSFSHHTNIETSFVEEAIMINILSHHLAADKFFMLPTLNWFCGVSQQLDWWLAAEVGLAW